MTTDDRDKPRVVDKVLRMIDEAGAQGADLVVLPEVWTGSAIPTPTPSRP